MRFGPVTLLLDFEEKMGWYSKGKAWAESPKKGPGYMRARGDGLHADLADGRIAFTIRAKSGYHEFFQEMIGPLKQDKRNLEAYLKAIKIWDLGKKGRPGLGKVRGTLAIFPDVVGKAMVSIKNAQPPKHLRNMRRLEQMERNVEDAYSQIMQFLKNHRSELYKKVAALNEKMSFRIGLGYDNNPSDRFLKWATFNMAFFRFAPSRLNIKDLEKRFAKVQEIMAEADRYGAKAILLVGGPARMSRPSDVTWNQDFLPINRPSFCSWNMNSKNYREGNHKGLRKAGKLTQDIDNIAVYQIGNEPFWSTQSAILCGYNPAEIGCSNKTWLQHVQKHYDSFDQWLTRYHEGDYRQKWKEKKRNRLIDWKSFEDMAFDPEASQGLTFVKFLKDRYGSLSALNRAWYGEDKSRYLDAWKNVFPPRPTREGAEEKADLALADIPKKWIPDQTEAPRPEKKDIPAWVDWAEFWSHSVNDSQYALYKGLKKGGAKAPVSTNAVTGHFINGFIHSSTDTATNPWISLKGLDAQCIDFYSTGYLQTYMSALRCAGEKRPVYLHETEGPKQGYVAMYSFAHGASGASIWRRDHDMPPTGALSLLKATRAMADPKLQKHSKPVTDGVALMYSQDSLYLSDAMTGSGKYYLESFQGASLLMSKLHVLYDLYSDRKLKDEIPDHVEVIFAPGAYALQKATFEKIHRFVEDGGVLMTNPTFGKYDRHGRVRPDVEREWLQESSRVKLLDKNTFRQWRRKLPGNDHTARLWAKADAPADTLKTVQETVAQHAPRTVRYRTSEQELADCAPGARLTEDGTLFVFVDPWAKDLLINVKGDYHTAFERFAKKELSVSHEEKDRTQVRVKKGPAIIRFDK